MTGVAQVTVATDEDGMRLDRWFRIHFPALGHGHLQKLLRTGQVRVDGKRAKAHARLEEGQTVRVPPLGAEAEPKLRSPKTGTLSEADRRMLREATLYEDDALLILNKPAGLAVQGGSKTKRHIDGMLVALEQETSKRWRLVHRLDRDTSGVLVIAKTRDVAAKLGRTFQSRSVRKIYWALTDGVPRPNQGKIDLPLIKAATSDGEQIRPAEPHEADQADRAVTLYNVVDRAGERIGFVSLKPITGRQHQLRVHLQAIGTPILGDNRYRSGRDHPPALQKALHLHARRISFRHPLSGDQIDVTAPLPSHMVESCRFLGFSMDATDEELADG